MHKKLIGVGAHFGCQNSGAIIGYKNWWSIGLKLGFRGLKLGFRGLKLGLKGWKLGFKGLKLGLKFKRFYRFKIY